MNKSNFPEWQEQTSPDNGATTSTGNNIIQTRSHLPTLYRMIQSAHLTTRWSRPATADEVWNKTPPPTQTSLPPLHRCPADGRTEDRRWAYSTQSSYVPPSLVDVPPSKLTIVEIGIATNSIDKTDYVPSWRNPTVPTLVSLLGNFRRGKSFRFGLGI